MSGHIKVLEGEDGQRLDRWLKKKFPDVGFGQMQKVLRTGQVRVDGKRAKGDTRLVPGQEVRIPPQFSSPQPRKERVLSDKDAAYIQSLVVYQDQDIIILNKPSGLAVQGGSKIKKHIDGMLDGLADNGQRPHLVHRLDKDTSGLLVLARTPKIAKILGDMFRERTVRKYYWAVTISVPEKEQGKIYSALAKIAQGGGERMRIVDKEDGKSALTFYQVMETIGDQLAWVAFWPKTGRTHQIRVHAAEIGCPLMGDDKYNNVDDDFFSDHPDLPRVLHLHARRVIFPHPVTGKKIDVTAPLGAEMMKTFKYFGFNAGDSSDPFKDVD